jgi:hypothetical protein
MDDLDRILEQKALRNVRSLVDKLEMLDAPQSWRPIVIAGALIMIAGLVVWLSSLPGAAAEEAERRQLSCELDIWLAKSGELERGFRQAHPGMPSRGIQELVERERPLVTEAARVECAGRVK